MHFKQAKVSTGDLQLGMFVSELDRPWLETPYKIQGFLIKSENDIETLIRYCEYVYVDVAKSKVDIESFDVQNSASDTEISLLSDAQQKQLLIDREPVHHELKSELEAELESAHTHYDALRETVKDLIDDKVGKTTIELSTLQKSVFPMVESVLRNPDAFTWLTVMKRHDDYTYQHAISTSVWATAFGRNLGLPIKDIQSLAIGGLLIDIGKVKLPVKLIQNPNIYNQYELKLVKKHVAYSVDIVEAIAGISNDVIKMVATHHERHNGAGYPHRLAGNKIPLFGKMAGIIDLYDAITSNRWHARAVSPHDAVKQLYGLRGAEFQAELVEQFIQVVGVYPVGTFVELSDGRIGAVVAHHRSSRLRPRVIMILDPDKKKYPKFRIINLYTENEDLNGNPLTITTTVNPERYGIDPRQLYL